MAEEKVMVCRCPSFERHTAPDISFGPMTREEAKKLIAHPGGGYILSMENWRKANLSRQVT